MIENKKVRSKKILRKIILVVEMHSNVLEFSQELESSGALSYLIVLTINLSMITLCGIVTVMKLDQPSESIRFLAFTLGDIFHLFFSSFQGQKLIDESENVFYSAYMSKWYDIPVEHQRLIVLIMARSTTPCRVTAGSLYIISMDTFSVLIKLGEEIHNIDGVIECIPMIGLHSLAFDEEFVFAYEKRLGQSTMRRRHRNYVSILLHLEKIHEIGGNVTKNRKVRSKEILQQIILVVKMHSNALEFSKELESTGTLSFLILSLINLSVITLCGIVTVMKLDQPSESIRFLAFTLGVIFHLFFSSFQGQRLIDESENVFHSAYMSEWYDIPVELQRLLVPIMARSVIPCKITAGSLFIISMDTFSVMMELFNAIKDDWLKIKTKHEIIIIHEYAEKGRKISVTCAITIAPRILDFWFPLNESRPFIYIFRTDYIIDKEKYYTPIIIHHFITAVIGITSIVAADGTYTVFVHHVCGMFTIVRHELSNISNSEKSKDYQLSDKTKISKQVINCMENHKKAIWLVLKYNFRKSPFHEFKTIFYLLKVFRKNRISSLYPDVYFAVDQCDGFEYDWSAGEPNNNEPSPIEIEQEI
ncbi:hypothetical protein PV327_000347 [Microctonus hyperodae]|uniref:Odorant receptor n=1 Tax=Microctonus hyperodae TaxID=165561 RepID=A0AA39L225_MICHY|nr:hypothetical protein PV327_000347 [Microctonus hyperodae]